VNLKAPAFLCREFAARHQAGQPAAIVNIADWRGLRPVPGHFSYTLTKAGLVALTQLLALELAPDIRVNAVAPGAILPPPGAGSDVLQRLAQQVPLKRHGGPADITEAILYLLRADFVTGEVLCVTGGEHLL
jgi:pteridine reductase